MTLNHIPPPPPAIKNNGTRNVKRVHKQPLFRALQQTFQSSTIFQTGARPFVLVRQQFEPAVLDISLNTSCQIHYNSRLYSLYDVLAHKNDKNLQLVYEVYIRRDCQVTLTFRHVTLLVTPPPPFVSWCDSLSNIPPPPIPPSVTYFLNGRQDRWAEGIL